MPRLQPDLMRMGEAMKELGFTRKSQSSSFYSLIDKASDIVHPVEILYANEKVYRRSEIAELKQRLSKFYQVDAS